MKLAKCCVDAATAPFRAIYVLGCEILSTMDQIVGKNQNEIAVLVDILSVIVTLRPLLVLLMHFPRSIAYRKRFDSPVMITVTTIHFIISLILKSMQKRSTNVRGINTLRSII